MARVAFIVDDVFEDSEFQVPYDRVRDAGHQAVIVGASAGKEITGKNGTKLTIEKGSSEVSADDFDAVVLPGGYSPDKVRLDQDAVSMVRSFYDDGKPVAAICHAPWILAEADVLRGKTITSWPSLRTDMVNAGATWVDEELQKDGNLITSRKPDDLPAFCDAVLSELS
ncbi:type 1 glutamine amidotransferase domain-containing protein [Phytoactinopolyspora halotolerans]|uniref:Type 1 glutamine amidotransferase n=1 Tax=Phytoactinopolyspora halotolerans TaxID=1981512 RepID=A0A6L9S6W0_9ACTN|nr:type 1 glutamine amidotransferase domain-containing protein [Phytoactinopolyspora halotolerans]NEE00713.1 type 1 glutamine amidotransferase [Phytoactinopolyspora halotolerans]